MGKGLLYSLLSLTAITEEILKDFQADLARKLPKQGISVSVHTAYKVHFDPHVIPSLILLKCRINWQK